ncbi:MAG TPA: sensor histidine kinase [Geodermatophilus sp.]|nr:sensor histidine kinase [Geodermatophilus sp.]
MRLIRLALWPAALAAGGVTAAFVLTGGLADSPELTAAIGVVVGLTWTLIGLDQRRRRPTRRIGGLMVALGFAWFAGLLVHAPFPLLHTVGLFCRALFIAVLGHLLLAFPSGRLEGRPARGIAVAAYVDTLVVNGASVLFQPSTDRARNLALIEPDAVLADAIRNAARGVGVVLLLASLVLVAGRWRRATPSWRRAVAPVLWWGATAAALAALHLLNSALGGPLGPVEPVFFVVLATVPVAFEVGLLRSRLARGAVADLVVQLGQTRAPGELRDALARALQDPDLTLAYWLPDQQRYVDLDGRPVDVPPADGSRMTTTVEHEGRRVAALVHDASLAENSELVTAVCAAAGLALENERLQAELRANLDLLRASRVRIVEAADAERRRVERDLHDGTQQRLVSIAMTLGLAESTVGSDPDGARRIVEEARTSLGAALQELREISQGLHPGILTERGLGPAVRELAYRAPVAIELTVPAERRLPPSVEAAAYYVVAEALANVAKHASATAVSVSVTEGGNRVVVEVCDDGIGGADPARGSGLRGLADRVEALGGTLAVDSPAGGGTRLRAEIPCAS